MTSTVDILNVTITNDIRSPESIKREEVKKEVSSKDKEEVRVHTTTHVLLSPKAMKAPFDLTPDLIEYYSQQASYEPH
jgi:hypothetical protein